MDISDVIALARLLEPKKIVIVGKMLSIMRKDHLFSLSIKAKPSLSKIAK